MKRIIFFIIILLIIYTPTTVLANSAGDSASISTNSAKIDVRVEKLENFLSYYNSPLTKYAAVFIQKADEYGLPDWKLVPAITGVESTFGKAIPFNSYNAYGWVNGAYNFDSWEQSIDIVTKTLKTKYYDRGIDTIDEIAHVYAPPSTTWSGKVQYFMQELDLFIPRKSSQLSVNL